MTPGEPELTCMMRLSYDLSLICIFPPRPELESRSNTQLTHLGPTSPAWPSRFPYPGYSALTTLLVTTLGP